MVRLSVAVQAHPRRAALVDELTARLAPLPVEIVWDPEPDDRLGNPWRTYRLALDGTPRWATHRLILQDDVTVCDGFAEAAPLALAARPDAVIVFCHLGRPRENLHRLDRAAREGRSLAEITIRRWTPVVATAYPAEIVCPIVCWVAEQDWPEEFRADDEIIGHALRELGARVYATVPSLAQHADVVPSLIGRRAWGGRDPGRVAHRWLEPPGDAREIAWT